MSQVETIKNLEYAKHDGSALHLDLYLPRRADGKMPVVMIVPGGGWRNCSKDNPPLFLTDDGFALAPIMYRVSSEAIAPANVKDCKAAVKWLRANAGRYNLDPDRIGACGSSAGGHLSALLGTAPDVAKLEPAGDNETYSSAVQAVCDMCGPSDLTRMAIPEIRERFSVVHEVTEQYLGGPVEDRLELARLVSPVNYVSDDCPPTLIIHGQDDPVVSVEESILFHRELSNAGADTSLHLLKGVGHGCPPELTSKTIIEFFKRTLL